MLSNIQKSIIIRALRIRQQNGENPAEAIKDYTKLATEEQSEVLAVVTGGPADGE